MSGAVGDAIAHQPHRGSDWIDPLLLRDVLLENIRLDGAGQFVEVAPALGGQTNVHRQQNPRRWIYRHGYRNILQLNTLEQSLHICEGIDGDALATDLPLAHWMIRVVTHQGRHIEVH